MMEKWQKRFEETTTMNVEALLTDKFSERIGEVLKELSSRMVVNERDLFLEMFGVEQDLKKENLEIKSYLRIEATEDKGFITILNPVFEREGVLLGEMWASGGVETSKTILMKGLELLGEIIGKSIKIYNDQNHEIAKINRALEESSISAGLSLMETDVFLRSFRKAVDGALNTESLIEDLNNELNEKIKLNKVPDFLRKREVEAFELNSSNTCIFSITLKTQEGERGKKKRIKTYIPLQEKSGDRLTEALNELMLKEGQLKEIETELDTRLRWLEKNGFLPRYMKDWRFGMAVSETKEDYAEYGQGAGGLIVTMDEQMLSKKRVTIRFPLGCAMERSWDEMSNKLMSSILFVGSMAERPNEKEWYKALQEKLSLEMDTEGIKNPQITRKKL